MFSTSSKIYDAKLSSNNVKTSPEGRKNDKSVLIAESYRASVIWSKLDRANTQISIGDTIVPEVSLYLSQPATLNSNQISV